MRLAGVWSPGSTVRDASPPTPTNVSYVGGPSLDASVP
jgi:hypothetical protein